MLAGMTGKHIALRGRLGAARRSTRQASTGARQSQRPRRTLPARPALDQS